MVSLYPGGTDLPKELALVPSFHLHNRLRVALHPTDGEHVPPGHGGPGRRQERLPPRRAESGRPQAEPPLQLRPQGTILT